MSSFLHVCCHQLSPNHHTLPVPISMPCVHSWPHAIHFFPHISQGHLLENVNQIMSHPNLKNVNGIHCSYSKIPILYLGLSSYILNHFSLCSLQLFPRPAASCNIPNSFPLQNCYTGCPFCPEPKQIASTSKPLQER